jgi:hypothetical protein
MKMAYLASIMIANADVNKPLTSSSSNSTETTYDWLICACGSVTCNCGVMADEKAV